MKKLVIIDGNSIAYRAFYALPILTNQKGLFTNSIFGFINMFFKIVDDLKPTHLAVVFDYPAKTFRHKLFKDYKATRKPMPSELAEQIPVIKETLKMLGAKVLEREGFEADDLIGTIAKKFNIPTVIITGDRDCLQLIDESTNVLLTKRGLTDTVLMDQKKFEEDYGFEPKGIVDLKAIMGDASDNIPGVNGIGEKGGKSLISKYKSLENVYKNIDEITGKAKTLLLEQKDMANLSFQLATINTHLEVNENEDDFKFQICLNKEVKEKMEDLEFNAILKRKEFLQEIKKETEEKQFKNIEIKEVEDLEKLNDLKNEIAIVFEQNSIHFADNEDVNYEVKIQKDLIDDGIDFKKALQILKPKFESENIKKICFDFKALKTYLANFEIELNNLCFDVHLANWLINSDENSDNISKVFEGAGFNQISACNLIKCKNFLQNKMQELDVEKLYNTIELPLVEVLFDMEKNGIAISETTLDEILKEYREKEQTLNKKICEYAGFEFNINSPKQLGNVLFDVLGLTSNKKQSTAVNVLLDLKDEHPIIDLILEYRTLSKIISTYLVAFKEFIKNGLVHTTYNQTGTATGRLSSLNPNLQNIPVKKDEGKLLRKMFVSRFENGEIVSADYNQIELRLVADLTGDEKMIEAFNSGKDIHQTTASEIFGVPLCDVTSKQRSSAKAVNFGIVYGISSYGLSEQIGVKPKEAGDYIKKYFEAYPGIKIYMTKIIEEAKQNGGYATTIFGRKRKVEEIFSANFQIKQFGERAIMNMPFQGSASDIIKIAMIKVYNRIKKENLKSKLILQIHDELIVDACKEEIGTIERILKEEMESVVSLKVRLTADVESGKTWFDV